ncbi:restriction endonuclease subunit S [Exiguobacterium profundum]|uniref:restriction endonuclease subunit S n=1 Tax=Exiguobacterium profundum TaxID=307643 RepID=UPI0033915D0E
MKTKLYPSIRFSSYVEEWTIQKFKDYTVKTGKKNSHNENYPAYSVSNKLGLVSQTEQFDGSRLENLSKESYKFVEPNEFAYNPARINVGSIAFNNLSETVLVSSLYVVIKMSTKIDNEYILQYIKSPIFNYEVKRNTEGSVREYLFYENFKNIKFPLPSAKEEQIKIGSFFKSLDETISLHQQELEALKQTKQGFLQKVFPAEGYFKPEISFSNVQETWDLKSLNDIATYRRGSFPQPYGNPEWYDIENGMPFIQVVDVGKSLKLNSDTKQKISKLAQPKSVFADKGKVLVTLQGSIGRVAITQYPAYVDRTLLIFESYKIPIDDRFFAYSIQNKFETERHKAPGGTIKTITKEALSKFEIPVPSFETQQKIGVFFNNIDEIIELKEQELEALKETKKGFLQKMFI